MKTFPELMELHNELSVNHGNMKEASAKFGHRYFLVLLKATTMALTHRYITILGVESNRHERTNY